MLSRMESLESKYARNRATIVACYDELQPEQQLRDMTSEEFADQVIGRTLLEAHFNGEVDAASRDALRPVVEWINQETHLAIEQMGFQWNQQTNAFNAPGGMGIWLYPKVRAGIIAALVNRGVEFFRGCEEHSGYLQPPTGEVQNLRTNLRAYLKKVAN